jgi:hypothetical protein
MKKLWTLMAGALALAAAWIKNPAVALLACAPACALVLCTAVAPRLGAQPYPINSPFYIPSAILGQQTITVAAGSSYVFQTNGQGTLYMRVSGSPVGLSAQVQVTEGRATQTVAQTLTSFTQANPGVFTLANHGLSINQPVVFTSAQSTLPTLIVSGTTYYVVAGGFTSSTFELAATPGGTAINTTAGSPSGTVTFSSTSLLWNNAAVDQVGGWRVSSPITATGLYKLNVSGAAAVRLNVSALTSGVTYVDFSASPGEEFVRTNPMTRATYRASASIGTGATTNFLVLAGSATKNVIITHADCSGRATAAIVVGIEADLRSTADSGDAGTAVTATPLDSSMGAATATVVSHTTSPTPGTLTGAVAVGQLGIVVAAPSVTDFPMPNVLNFEFARWPGSSQVVLHGVAQEFSLTTSAAFGTAAAVTCNLEWQED